jgi:hypothetical protein
MGNDLGSGGGRIEAKIPTVNKPALSVSLFNSIPNFISEIIKRTERASGLFEKVTNPLPLLSRLRFPMRLCPSSVCVEGLFTVHRRVTPGLEQRNICARATQSYAHAYACWTSGSRSSQSREWRVFGSAHHT